ncbi:hypothetical protein AG1IA_09274 [Rhizoctonia solani AG-1 IA]|uniref:Uncharacterized protein n=1 Tax=Thanatephorus cucumeris (strain AG1-IA) TaxID=983506 RepID=L8WK06_THACA|nr:hypothetical protein AG1IA_09274 [Rhizoctonia solani AG-1 IA]
MVEVPQAVKAFCVDGLKYLLGYSGSSLLGTQHRLGNPFWILPAALGGSSIYSSRGSDQYDHIQYTRSDNNTTLVMDLGITPFIPGAAVG